PALIGNSRKNGRDEEGHLASIRISILGGVRRIHVHLVRGKGVPEVLVGNIQRQLIFYFFDFDVLVLDKKLNNAEGSGNLAGNARKAKATTLKGVAILADFSLTISVNESVGPLAVGE